jgi:hypothetical protein
MRAIPIQLDRQIGELVNVFGVERYRVGSGFVLGRDLCGDAREDGQGDQEDASHGSDS